MNIFPKYKKTLTTAATATLTMFAFAEANAHSHWRATSNFQDRSFFQSTINNLDSSDRDIDGLAITPNGNWILISDSDVWSSSGFSSSLKNDVSNYVNLGNRVDAADCSETGACIVIYDNWEYDKAGSVPSSLTSKINTYKNNQWRIRDVEVTQNGYVLLGPGNVANYSNMDSDLNSAIYDRHRSGRSVDNVEVGFNGEWAIIADHNPMYENVHSTVANRLDSIGRSNNRIDEFVIGVGSNYVAYSGGNYSPSTNSPMDEIEFGLGSGNSTNIWDRMDELGVSGASIAIIEQGVNNPKVTYARGYGRKKADEQKPVLGKTPFKLASLSKYLGGLVVLDQVESDSSVQLTTDVTSICSNCNLDDWKDIGESWLASLYGIPNTNLGTGITIERVLNHTAGINNFSTRIAQSSWATANNRDSSDWLLGMTCSNGTCDAFGGAATWRTMTSGAQYSYSNGGFLIAQAYLEDKDGDTIDDILQSRLFDQIGMDHSSGDLQLSNSYVDKVAWQHNSSGPRSELTQSVARLAGGVWSSSKDYAEAMIVALNEGRNSQGQRVLNASSVTELLSSSPRATYGLGVDFRTTVTESNDRDFYHNGANGGRVYTYMCGNPTRDEGIVILLNTESANARTFAAEVRRAYLRAVGWPSSRTCT